MSRAKEKTSCDYPRLAKEMLSNEMLETSGNGAPCKLPSGLYLVATPIGHLGDITLRALVTLATCDLIACEDTRVSGGMLAKYGIKKPLLPYHDHNADAAGKKILEHIKGGETVALISDAGMPLISDPGFPLVTTCQKAGYPVTVIPGANAALTALSGSGLPANEFHFVGFLPAKQAARKQAIAARAQLPGTLIIYEAPQRLADCLTDLASLLGKERPAAVARELTKLFEETKRGTLGDLATTYEKEEVKGEIVVLIGPAEAKTASTQDLEALLKNALKNQSLRDAVNNVSILTGAKKSEVYDLALRLSKEK